MRLQRINTLISVIAIQFSVFSPQLVHAEAGVICAAVYPCESDGTVSAPFNEGECGDYYADICSQKYLTDLASRTVACEDRRADMVSELDRVNRKMRSMKTRLRKLAKRK